MINPGSNLDALVTAANQAYERIAQERIAFIDRVNMLQVVVLTKFNQNVKDMLAEGLMSTSFDFTEEQVNILLNEASALSIKSLILNWEVFKNLGFTPENSIAAIRKCRSIDLAKLNHVNVFWQDWINKGIPRSEILTIMINSSANYNMSNLTKVFVALEDEIYTHIENGKLPVIDELSFIQWIIRVAGKASGVHALEAIHRHLSDLVEQGCTYKQLEDMTRFCLPEERIKAFLYFSNNAANVFTLQQRVDIVSGQYGHKTADVLKLHLNKLINTYGFSGDDLTALSIPQNGESQIEGLAAYCDALHECLVPMSAQEKKAVFALRKNIISLHFNNNAGFGGRVLKVLGNTTFGQCSAEVFMTRMRDAVVKYQYSRTYSNLNNDSNDHYQTSSKKMKR